MLFCGNFSKDAHNRINLAMGVIVPWQFSQINLVFAMSMQGQHKRVFARPSRAEDGGENGRFGEPDKPRIGLFWTSADKNPDKDRFSLENSRKVFCVCARLRILTRFTDR